MIHARQSVAGGAHGIEACAPAVRDAVDALRAYLDAVGFTRIFKYLVGFSQYAVTPSLVAAASAAQVEAFFDTVLPGRSELAILRCLMTGRPAAYNGLGEPGRRLAAALQKGGLLADHGGTSIGPAGYQLISAFDNYLLIDRRIHFGGGAHEVYVGPDSYWMLYYLDRAMLRGRSALDLCTGTGIGALTLALAADRVVATDIGDAPLALAAINSRLNGCEHRISLRREDLRDTVAGNERFDVVTCNPPFVAFPPDYPGTLFAHGAGEDGLDYLRLILDRLPSLLNDGGSAYLVADLVGDTCRPHFAAELEAIATARHLSIDLFIDNAVPAAWQVEPLSTYLEAMHAGSKRAEIARALGAFQAERLKADCYYMSTIHARQGAATPGVRLFDRAPRGVGTAGRSGDASKDSWPALLRA